MQTRGASAEIGTTKDNRYEDFSVLLYCLIWLGYLTSFGNILGTWFFQIPANLLAVLMVNKLVYAGNEIDEITLTSGDSG